MDRLGLIGIEWNRWNGFVFELMYYNDRCLIGLAHGYKSYIVIDFLYLQIEFNYKRSGKQTL